MSNLYDGENLVLPTEMPLLPVRDIVVFPYMILPLFVGRDTSIKAVEDAMAHNRIIFLVSQKDVADENPEPERIYEVGTIAMIMRLRKLPDGRIKILTQGLSKGKILKYSQQKPYFKVEVEKITETENVNLDVETEALIRTVKEQLEKVVSMGKALSPDILLVVEDIYDAGKLADIITSNIGLKVQDAQKILEIKESKERLLVVNEILLKEIEVLSLQAKIKNVARDEMAKSQREYYLREQIKAIKSELGDTDNKTEEVDELREKIRAAKMPQEVETEALKQLGRLERMHPDASEASVVRTYVDWLIDVPWSKASEDRLDLVRAKEILNEDHYDLEEVKERILEHLAVTKLKKTIKGPILCFAGPPGVGKTSLGKSIARALGRQFIRISLGGVKDEAEIRGHRRTYVGALPGMIIQGLKTAGTNNPVFMLDEIDKLGADFKGDPSSALLEVLDPEQNFSFRDHYVNLPFNLSNVMFIATANVVDTIPPALRDRMEIMYLSGYTSEEKIKIANKYLIPKQIKENGVEDNRFKINDKTLLKMIMEYTQEAGLRNLERVIARVCRKVARVVAEGKKAPATLTGQMVEKFLGPAQFLKTEVCTENEVGIATGLAWTQFGGEVLSIEAATARGSGLRLTGNLGDVMKESAMAALSYAKTKASDYGIDEDFFDKHEIHVHVPSGAVPKDGPSAGITIATAILSLLTQRPINKCVAMTGEITLTGKVLPIGGLKEKALAAMRAGITTIIAPKKNEKDLINIPNEYRKKVEFVFVSHIDEVIKLALMPKSIKGIDNGIDSFEDYRRKNIKAVA